MPKFKDIPKLYRSYYRVAVSLDAIKETLDRYKENQEKFGYKFELNPIFQRGHVWTRKQQIKYIEWLLMDGESGREIYFNHPDWMKGFKADMVCVDGLQRLTACTEFLQDKIAAFGHYYSEYTDKIMLNGNNLYFNIGALSEKQCVEWYLQMNFTGTPHSEKELKRVKEIFDNM